MKRLFFRIVLVLLILVNMGLAEQEIQLPDQYLSCKVNGGCQVQRQPNTEIVSLTKNQDEGIFSTYVGALNFDHSGNYTLHLVEYDSDTETTYKTTVHVKVSPKDPTIEWKWDKSGNSAQTMKWIAEKGNIFAVGQQVSFRSTCKIDGVEQKVVYSSNNPGVASVNENGLVTMRSAGCASILMKAEGTDTAWDNFVIVHDGEAWTNTWGDFDPKDNSETMNIYKKPDTGSAVIAVKRKGDTGNFYVVSRGSVWSKVSYNGKVGYAQTGKLTFGDGFEGTTPEDEKLQVVTDESAHANTEDKVVTASDEYEIKDNGEKNGKPVSSTNSASTTQTGIGNGKSRKKLTQIPEPDYDIYFDHAAARLIQLGVNECEIIYSGSEKEQKVSTASVFWESTAPDQYRIASIKAPKNGGATMRVEANEKSEAVAKVGTGILVPVLEHGKQYSRIAYSSYTGYVKNSALDFYSGKEKTKKAVIIYDGTRLHSGAGAGYSTIGSLAYGKDITIIKTKGNWAMVNVDGYVGYVATKYIAYR